MTGAFGGEIVHADGVTYEPLATEFAARLSSAYTTLHDPLQEAAPGNDAAAPVWFEIDAAGRAVYSLDVSAWRAIDTQTEKGAVFAMLASVARGLQSLHAIGIVHADVRPETIRIGPDNAVALLTSKRASNPGAVLRARLHPGGVAPTEIAFVAPEVIAGFEATPASDVFALAAIAHLALTGFAPFGQLDLRAASRGPLAAFVPFVYGGLNAVPGNRPTIAQFIAAADQASRAASATPEPTLDTGYRAPSPNAPSDFHRNAPPTSRGEAPQTSVTLTLLLVIGGGFAFIGAALLVFTGWDVVGEMGRLAMLGVLSAAVFGAGSLARKKGFDSSARALQLAAGTLALLAGAYGFYLLGDSGRTVFLAVLVLGSFAAGVFAERNGSPRSGLALLTLGTQLIWLFGGWLIHLEHADKIEGPVALLAAVVTAVSYGVALARRSPWLSFLAAIDFAVCAGAFGAFISTGSVTGPATYSVAVAAGYVLLAWGCTLRGSRELAWPFIAGFIICVWTSASAALAIMDHHETTNLLFGALWPYALIAATALMAIVWTPFRTASAYTAASLATFVPTIEALIRYTVPFAVLAVVIGFAFVVFAFRISAFASDSTRQFQSVCAGLIGVTAVPDLHVLHYQSDRTGMEILFSADGVYLIMVIAVSAGLVMASFAYSRFARSRTHYRMLEFIALAQLFGLFTLRSLINTSDWFFPLCALALAAVTLGVGLSSRRAALTVLAAGTIVLNAWIQYFVRLQRVAPIAVLLVGFGAGLLALGVWYEKTVKPWLPTLRDWA